MDKERKSSCITTFEDGRLCYTWYDKDGKEIELLEHGKVEFEPLSYSDIELYMPFKTEKLDNK